MSLFSLCWLYFGSGSLFSFRSQSNFLLRAGQRIWKSSFTEFALKFWFALTPEGFSFSSESSILVEVWPGSSDAGAVSPIFALVSPSIHAHKLAWDIAHVCIDYLRFICDGKVTAPNYFKIVQKHSLCLNSSILDSKNFKYPIIHLRASSGQVFLQLQIYLSLAEKNILKENRVWLNGDMVTFLAKKTWKVLKS